MENNVNILDEMYKGCDMGVQAIDMIIKKVGSSEFRDLLDDFKVKYEQCAKDIADLYHDYSDSEVHEINTAEKFMTWYGIMKDTMFDESDSKIADLLINGTNMGIVEGRKLLNNKKMNKDVHNLCEKYVKFQEKYIEKLKKFL